MKNEIYPCLWFDGNAKAAATFYGNVFPGSSIITDTPMVVMFALNGKKIMGLNGGPMFKMNPSISMFVHCVSLDKCQEVWDGLLDGGTVLMALDKYPWSEQYGWLQDKFGFTWQIMKSDTASMMPSLLFTGKQMGRAAEAIDFYTGIFESSAITVKNIYEEGSPFAGNVAYAEFTIGNYPVVAMDGPGEHQFAFSEGVSFVVNCASQQEINFYWDAFVSNGGTESMCGWCKDKFGVSWQIVPANIGQIMVDAATAPGAMQRMMQMKKIDIAVLMGG